MGEINLEKVLDTLSLIGIITITGMCVFFYSRLPAVIPIHFNEAGIVDGYVVKYGSGV